MVGTWVSLEGSNDRNINKMLVNQVLPTCQLQMGMTELLPGSVWNTMPAHVHSRRMEAYFYFEVPEDQAVCHFMGQVDETRHIWMKGDQAVLSPEWSIHSAAATHNYTFIWGWAARTSTTATRIFENNGPEIILRNVFGPGTPAVQQGTESPIGNFRKSQYRQSPKSL